MKPRVHVITTGGTVACAPAESLRSTGYHDAVFDAKALLAPLCGIEEKITITTEEIFRVGSRRITDENLLALSKRVNQVLSREDVDGVVITHGTDTMEETAFFLNLTVKSEKPVILTGSMRPTGAISADGPGNLLCALLAASSQEARGKGVMIAFADHLWPARDVRKVSTYHTDAFQCSEGGALGMVVDKARFYYTPCRPHTASSGFDLIHVKTLPKVEIFFGKIAEDERALKIILESGFDGVVIAGVGNGNLTSGMKNLLSPTKGRPFVVRSSRTMSGPISQSGSLSDQEMELIPGGSFSPQKVRILLQIALTKTKNYREICDIFDRY